MRLAVSITTPEVLDPVPVALLSGSFAQKLAAARGFGFDGVELMSNDPRALDAAELRRQIEDAGLAVAAIASGAILPTLGLTLMAETRARSDAALARGLALVELAHAVGAPTVTIGGFRGRAALVGGADAARERLGAAMLRLAEEARAAGVWLAVEAINRFEADFLLSAAEVVAFLDTLGADHVGLLLDTFHMNIEEPNIGATVRSTAAHIRHVHLGDSNRHPPGKGHFDFAALTAALRAAGYDAWLSAELLPRPDPYTAARLTAEHMRPLL